jgi:hypothetical protein
MLLIFCLALSLHVGFGHMAYRACEIMQFYL